MMEFTILEAHPLPADTYVWLIVELASFQDITLLLLIPTTTSIVTATMTATTNTTTTTMTKTTALVATTTFIIMNAYIFDVVI